jgi:hypothetical protein
MRADEADYLDWSGQIAHSLRRGDWLEAARAVWGNAQRGPLAIIPAAAAQAIVGRTDPDAARAANLVWLILALLATYRLGVRLHSPGAGLVASAALAAMPLMMGFSRSLWFDVPLSAMTALTMLMLVRTDCFTRPRAAVALGVVAGLGLLTKLGLVIFVAGPTVGCLVIGLRRPGQRRRAIALAALAAGVAILVLASWAGPHWREVMKAFTMARPGAVPTDGPGLAGFYVLGIPKIFVGPLLTALFVLAGVVLVLQDRRRVLTISGLWLGGALLLLEPFVQQSRYFLPALPAIALITGAGLCSCSALSSRRWALPLLLVVLGAYAVQQSWFGPLLVWCDRPSPLERTDCASAVRPAHVVSERPDLRGLPSDRWTFVGVAPGRLEGVSPPALGCCVPETIRYWLLLDGYRQVEVESLVGTAETITEQLRRCRLVILLDPGPSGAVPVEEQTAHRTARALVEGDHARWALDRTFRFASGDRLAIYRSARIEAIPSTSTW